jgi:phenylalanyl-tRNA synthetase beta chain
MRPDRCDALLGTKTPAKRQLEILAAIGLQPKAKGDKIACTIPSHRADLQREVDLIEEIARVQGYDKITVHREISHSVKSEGLTQRTRRIVQDAMSGAGFDEAVTNTFVDAEEAQLFGWETCVTVDPVTRKRNNVLRWSVIPSLLRACKTNQDAGTGDVHLFELAAVFSPNQNAPLPAEHVELGLMSTGELRDVRGALEAVLEQIAPQARLEVCRESLAGFGGDLSGLVLIDDEAVGSVGVIAPEVLDYYGLNPDRPIAAGTIAFDALLDRAGAQRTYEPLGKFPPVRRDLSVVVDEDVTWAAIAETVAAVDQPTRTHMNYVTTYRGEQIAPGRKSVTFALTYRSPHETLRSEQVDAQVEEVVSVLKNQFAAELRA